MQTPVSFTTLAALVVLAAGLTLASCGGKKADTAHPITYRKDGLSFQMPGNWRVTEDASEEGIRYLFVEEPGDAIVVVQLLGADDALGIAEYARSFAEQAKEGTDVGTLSASTFSRAGEAGGYETLRETFHMTLLGVTVPHTRDYRRRLFGDQVCFLVAQVSDEDRGLVTGGFRLITSTLTYEP